MVSKSILMPEIRRVMIFEFLRPLSQIIRCKKMG